MKRMKLYFSSFHKPLLCGAQNRGHFTSKVCSWQMPITTNLGSAILLYFEKYFDSFPRGTFHILSQTPQNPWSLIMPCRLWVRKHFP